MPTYALDLTGSQNGNSGYQLPKVKFVFTPVSFDLTQDRPVGGNTWFTVGDGLARPAPVTIEVLISALSEAGARTQLAAVMQAALNAKALVRGDVSGGGVYGTAQFGTAKFGEEFERPVLGVLGMTPTLLDVQGRNWSLTVTFAAAGPYWADSMGNGSHLF